MATKKLRSTRRLAGLTLAGMGLICGPAGAPVLAADLSEDLGTKLIEGYIGPATQGFADASAAMHVAMQRYCNTPEPMPVDGSATAGALAERPSGGVVATTPGVASTAGTVASQEARQRFSDLAQAWARVEFLRFGPLVEDNRFERIFFWPDPRGTVQRRTQATLASNDDALLTPGALRATSVAIQGLPSLEYALYGGAGALLAPSLPDASATEAPQGSVPADSYRCAYASAVAANLSMLAAEVAQAWGPGGDMAQRFGHPGPENPLYRTPTEVAAEMIKALSGGMHYIRDAKLLAALGATPAEAKPARAPLWRSDVTLDVVAAELRGMAEFYQAAQLTTTFAPADAWLATVVSTSASHIADRLDALDMPLEQALAQSGPRASLVSAVVELNTLKEMIDGQVASALGINVGFNALDGD